MMRGPDKVVVFGSSSLRPIGVTTLGRSGILGCATDDPGLTGAAGDAGAFGAAGIFGSRGVSTGGATPGRNALDETFAGAAGGASMTAVFLAAFFRGFALTFFRSTFAAVSTAMLLATTPPNHSRIVAASPADSADMWFVMSGIPSSVHFSTMALEVTPISLATW
jgi:hypothetical protein